MLVGHTVRRFTSSISQRDTSQVSSSFFSLLSRFLSNFISAHLLLFLFGRSQENYAPLCNAPCYHIVRQDYIYIYTSIPNFSLSLKEYAAPSLAIHFSGLIFYPTSNQRNKDANFKASMLPTLRYILWNETLLWG